MYDDPKREVSSAEGEALAKKIGAVFIETSAKNNFNVEEAFFELVRAIGRDPTVILLFLRPSSRFGVLIWF